MFESWDLATLVDTIFLFSLALIMIGGALFVLQGGFFNAFVYSSKRLLRRGSKQESIIREIEGERDQLPNRKRFPILYPLLIIGGILFILTLVISLFL